MKESTLVSGTEHPHCLIGVHQALGYMVRIGDTKSEDFLFRKLRWKMTTPTTTTPTTHEYLLFQSDQSARLQDFIHIATSKEKSRVVRVEGKKRSCFGQNRTPKFTVRNRTRILRRGQRVCVVVEVYPHTA